MQELPIDNPKTQQRIKGSLHFPQMPMFQLSRRTIQHQRIPFSNNSQAKTQNALHI